MADENKGNPKEVLKYNPQLDGLRFFAVFFVVSYHWLHLAAVVKMSYYLGGMVNFFFVLSSYLITRILFSANEKGTALGVSKFKVMLVFIMRRTIRIFPAFYVFLIIAILMPVVGDQVRAHALTYFLYVSNYQIFATHDFPSLTAHIWTLAVEEQFYLLWPLVILFVPRKHLLKTFIVIILASVIIRALFYYPAVGVPQDILTQYCVDAFAIGGLLAYKTLAPEPEQKLITKYFNIVLLVLAPFGLYILFSQSLKYSFIVNKLFFSMVSYKIIEGAVLGYENWMGRFLQTKFVVYIGRISYGIYLYHLMVPVVFWKLFRLAKNWLRTDHPAFFLSNKKWVSVTEHILVSPVGSFVLYASLAIGIAALSAKYVEAPLNKLKLSYHPGTKKQVAAVKPEAP